MSHVNQRSKCISIALAVFLCFLMFTNSSWAITPDELHKIESAVPQKARVSPKQPRKLLVFNLCQGWAHTSIPYVAKALEIMGKKTGAFEAVVSSDMASFAPENLKQFDAVCFNNTTHLEFKDPALRQSLMDFVRGGKGIVGIHAATDNFYNWPEAAEMMGGQYEGHPWTHEGTWAIKIEDAKHPLAAAFGGKNFKINDEIYRIKPLKLRENCHVLLGLDMTDETNLKADGVSASDKDIPISWVRSFGKGRVFYCSFGHNPHIFWNPVVLQHYLDGIQFAMGDLKADTTPSAKTTITAAAEQRVLPYSYFLSQLVDLDRLPYLESGTKCAQASSYCRLSRYDAKTNTYIDWEANDDWGYYISVDEATGEALMADLKGPGCIRRIWSANPHGKIRFYLDGDTEPTYEFEFMKLFSGGIEPFRRPVVWCRKGDEEETPITASDSYLPIPFARSCRVTMDKKYRMFYHIGYQTFSPSTQVESFRLPLTESESKLLDRVCKTLSNCGVDPQPKANAESRSSEEVVIAGSNQELFRLTGPATITEFSAKILEREAARTVTLRVYWDGAKEPSIEAPLDDFFGGAAYDQGDKDTQYKSLAMGITDKLNYCYWRMPFRKEALFMVENNGQADTQITFRASYVRKPVADNAAYFHAKWRREAFCNSFEYPFLEACGWGKVSVNVRDRFGGLLRRCLGHSPLRQCLSRLHPHWFACIGIPLAYHG